MVLATPLLGQVRLKGVCRAQTLPHPTPPRTLPHPTPPYSTPTPPHSTPAPTHTLPLPLPTLYPCSYPHSTSTPPHILPNSNPTRKYLRRHPCRSPSSCSRDNPPLTALLFGSFPEVPFVTMTSNWGACCRYRCTRTCINPHPSPDPNPNLLHPGAEQCPCSAVQ